MVSIILQRAASSQVADDLPALATGTRRYTCRNFKQDFSPRKQEARERLLKIVTENPAFGPQPNGGIAHALTLPGPWWHFERGVGSIFNHFYFTGIEREQSLFRLAAIRMPRGAKSEDPSRFYSTYQHKTLGCPVVRGLAHKLLNADIHHYLRVTEHEFGLIWLDLCAPLSRRILYSVVSSSRILRGDGAVFALTVQAARESIDMLMEMGGAENRLNFIGDVCRALLGRDFHEVSRFRYSDGAPMVQYVFRRDVKARKSRTPLYAKRLVESIKEAYEKLPAYRPDTEFRNDL